MPASQIAASGIIYHSDMDEATVLAKVKSRFPKAAIGGMDFVIPLGDCEAEFYRTNSTALEFHVKPVSSSGSTGAPNPARAVTAAEMLVRATETLWFGLEQSLRTGRWKHRPTLKRCSIEDTYTTTTLLARETQSPLLSSGAKVAYAFSVLYLVAAIILTYWQFATPHSKDVRQANVLGIALALVVAAVSTPAPVFMSWREWKGSLSWKYVRSTP